MTLSSFTQRRLIRGAIAILGVTVFLLIQAWQTNGTILPGQTATTTSATNSVAAHPIFVTSTERGVSAMVSRTVDGDTIEVKILATNEDVKVRLLGMNTPESVDPRRPVQCFGKEASHHMKELLEGKEVFLIDDPKADDRDKYGRWLRNVVRKEDLLDVNATLVAEGYASAYLSFPLDGKRKAQIRQLEEEAKTNQRGLWSPSTCEGKK